MSSWMGAGVLEGGWWISHFLARGRIGRLITAVWTRGSGAGGWGWGERRTGGGGGVARVVGASGVVVVDGSTATGEGRRAYAGVIRRPDGGVRERDHRISWEPARARAWYRGGSPPPAGEYVPRGAAPGRGRGERISSPAGNPPCFSGAGGASRGTPSPRGRRQEWVWWPRRVPDSRPGSGPEKGWREVEEGFGAGRSLVDLLPRRHPEGPRSADGTSPQAGN